MIESSYIVLGGTGLIGSAVCNYLKQLGKSVISVNSKNYENYVGAKTRVLINCNGNSKRYRANQEPHWDFEKSVITVERSLYDFSFDLYIYISTVDLYSNLKTPECNHEKIVIEPEKLNAYSFHKWMAERLVEKYASRSLILRLGTVVGKGMTKGPIYDILNSQTLHMSLDSELTLIDTITIAKVINGVIKMNPKHEIINLTGTGSVRFRDLQKRFGALFHGVTIKSEIKHIYNINNSKLRNIMTVPSSMETAVNFINNYLKEKE